MRLLIVRTPSFCTSIMSKTHQECLTLLEQLRWQGKPQCPYCGSCKPSAMAKERRYHCNFCFTSFSVTVGTLFHKSRIDLYKWFRAIELLLLEENKISVRKLAEEIDVSKNTAEYMILRIKKAEERKDLVLLKISQYIQKQKSV